MQKRASKILSPVNLSVGKSSVNISVSPISGQHFFWDNTITACATEWHNGTDDEIVGVQQGPAVP